jgi:hypothetical protein
MQTNRAAILHSRTGPTEGMNILFAAAMLLLICCQFTVLLPYEKPSEAKYLKSK